MSKNLFFAGLILAASGFLSPPLALAMGLIYGFALVHPYHLEAKLLSKLLLQVSVVGLGFGINLHQVIQAGRSGFVYTAASITFAMLLVVLFAEGSAAHVFERRRLRDFDVLSVEVP